MTLHFVLRLLRAKGLKLRKKTRKFTNKTGASLYALKSNLYNRLLTCRAHIHKFKKYSFSKNHFGTKFGYGANQRRLLLGVATASISTFGFGVTNVLCHFTNSNLGEERKKLSHILNPNPQDPSKLIKKQQKQNDWGWQIPRRFPDKPPVMVLVVDGGGLRGAMTTQILKELETEIKKIDPNLELRNCFDFLMGTSTGGLICLGISKLNWNCDDIDQFYDTLGSTVFRQPKAWYNPTKYIDLFWQAVSLTGLATSLKTKNLEKHFKEVIDPNKKMREVSTKYNDEPYMGVVATLTSNFTLPSPMIFRNYDITNEGYTVFGQENHYFLPGISDCKVWEAARATSAAPTYFAPLKLQPDKAMRKKMIIFQLRQHWAQHGESGKLTHDQKSDIANIVANAIDNNINHDTICDKIHKYYHKWENSKDLASCKDRKGLKKVLSNDYSLSLVDGGVISNSPILFGYTEVCSLWPRQDVCILALGTGQQSKLNVFNNKKAKIYMQTLFQSIFGAKETATILPIISFGHLGAFRLTRWNPEIDMAYSDMAYYGNMPYFRKTGQDYAKKFLKNGSIQFWAQILAQHANDGNIKRNRQQYQERKAAVLKESRKVEEAH